MAPGKEPENEKKAGNANEHHLDLLALEVAGAGPCLLVLPGKVR